MNILKVILRFMNIFSEKNPVSMIVNSLFKKKTTKKMLSGPK